MLSLRLWRTKNWCRSSIVLVRIWPRVCFRWAKDDKHDHSFSCGPILCETILIRKWFGPAQYSSIVSINRILSWCYCFPPCFPKLPWPVHCYNMKRVFQCRHFECTKTKAKCSIDHEYNGLVMLSKPLKMEKWFMQFMECFKRVKVWFSNKRIYSRSEWYLFSS